MHEPRTGVRIREERVIAKKNLAEGFAAFQEPWSPRVAGDINDMQIKLVKLEGEFIWHRHDEEDELFLVISGRLRMEFREQEAQVLEPGEFIIVPHGVEHRPVAEEPCEVVLLEPGTTLNTGNVDNERNGSKPGARLMDADRFPRTRQRRRESWMWRLRRLETGSKRESSPGARASRSSRREVRPQRRRRRRQFRRHCAARERLSSSTRSAMCSSRVK